MNICVLFIVSIMNYITFCRGYKLLESKKTFSLIRHLELHCSPQTSISSYKDILKLTSFQEDKLEELCEVIKYWNERVNLISRKDIDSLIPNHILPSLAIHSYRRFQKDESVIDVGTGIWSSWILSYLVLFTMLYTICVYAVIIYNI